MYKKKHVDANTGSVLQNNIVYEMRDLLPCKIGVLLLMKNELGLGDYQKRPWQS